MKSPQEETQEKVEAEFVFCLSYSYYSSPDAALATADTTLLSSLSPKKTFPFLNLDLAQWYECCMVYIIIAIKHIFDSYLFASLQGSVQVVTQIIMLYLHR